MTGSRRLLLAVASALLVAGCGGDHGDAAGPASFAPQGVPVYLEVSRESDEQIASAEALIAELGEVPLLGSTLDPRDLIEEVIDELAAEEGYEISFAEDIEPWLGDRAALVLTSIELETATTPDFVVVIEANDDVVAAEAIERLLAADDSSEIVEDEIGGVAVKRLEGAQGGLGVVDGFVVLGSTDEALEAAIAAHSDESLEDRDDFAEALDSVPAERLAAGYVNVGAILEAAVREGDVPSEIEAFREVYGDTLDQPIALAFAAGESSLVLDVSSGAFPSVFPTATPSALLTTAPGDSIAAIGFDDVGAQLLELYDLIVQISGAQLGGLKDPDEFAERLETELGLEVGDAASGLGAGVASLRGEFPDAYLVRITIERFSLNDPLIELLDRVQAELKRDGWLIGPPLRGGRGGFSAEIPDGGGLGFIGVVVNYREFNVVLASSRAVAEERPAAVGDLGNEELYGIAADALGADFEIAGFADLGPILDVFVGSGSLLDLATGAADAEQAIASFLADRLGFAALGIRAEDDRMVQRFVVGLD